MFIPGSLGEMIEFDDLRIFFLVGLGENHQLLVVMCSFRTAWRYAGFFGRQDVDQSRTD